MKHVESSFRCAFLPCPGQRASPDRFLLFSRFQKQGCLRLQLRPKLLWPVSFKSPELARKNPDADNDRNVLPPLPRSGSGFPLRGRLPLLNFARQLSVASIWNFLLPKPSPPYVENVRLDGPQPLPVRGSMFSDVFKATWHSELVCLKRLRVFEDDETKNALYGVRRYRSPQSIVFLICRAYLGTREGCNKMAKLEACWTTPLLWSRQG